VGRGLAARSHAGKGRNDAKIDPRQEPDFQAR